MRYAAAGYPKNGNLFGRIATPTRWRLAPTRFCPTVSTAGTAANKGRRRDRRARTATPPAARDAIVSGSVILGGMGYLFVCQGKAGTAIGSGFQLDADLRPYAG